MNDYKELIGQLNGACIVKVVMKDMQKADLFSKAADAIEQLVKERDEWMKYAKQERKRSIERSHELAVELEQVKKERDAAVEDLTFSYKHGTSCFACKHDFAVDAAEYCIDCKFNSNFEWRGVQENNDEID